ncbi:5-hydroxytryptamine receptor 6-like [Mercenaria mercenaria]|uniref:5-hydroxytryptamine receptor 6-like n=1 Tax=Mercenaria mercenaria TaxID=6596 RepID=UPI001E1DC337|nr:5-hydroxytryptamine receptor 6-like [Mercenaria mercenaria]
MKDYNTCRNTSSTCTQINQSFDNFLIVSTEQLSVNKQIAHECVDIQVKGERPDVVNIMIGAFLFLLVLLTIIGNVVVFLAVICNKKLRTVSNIFIISLSLADLLVGTVVMIPAVLSEIFQRWILAHSFCVFWAGFDVMLCSASILNVCLISLDRYIAIMSPLRYKVLVTYRRAMAMLAAAWGIAISASFIPLLSGIHNPELPSLTNLTLLSDTPQCLFIPSLIYVVIASTVTILLPIIVALVLYYRVSKEAKRQACFVGVLITPTNMLLGAKVANKHIREPFTRKATVTLGIIVGAYVVTWAPFLVINVTDAICRCVPAKLFTAFVWLGWCNSLINPIIYPFFMRDFRKVYSTALLKLCPCLKLICKYKKDKVFHRDSVEVTSTKIHYDNSEDAL